MQDVTNVNANQSLYVMSFISGPYVLSVRCKHASTAVISSQRQHRSKAQQHMAIVHVGGMLPQLCCTVGLAQPFC